VGDQAQGDGICGGHVEREKSECTGVRGLQCRSGEVSGTEKGCP
jgi:hypothetical protein